MKSRLLYLICFVSFLGFGQEKWSLHQCIDYAIQNNLHVIQGKYSSEVEKNNLLISNKNWLPNVSGTMSNNANFGQGRDVFGQVNRNDNYSNSLNVGANIQLYNGNRLRKNAEQTQYNVEASLYDLENVKNDISIQIVQLYLQALLNKEVFKISESSVENAQKLYNRAKITTEVGTTPLTIQYEAQANLSREKQKLVAAQVDIDRSLFNLALLLQLESYVGFDVEDVDVSNDLEKPLASIDGVLDIAYREQYKIKAAEIRVLSAEKGIEIAKTDFLPTVSANAGIGTSFFNSFVNKNYEGLLKQYEDNFIQQLGLTINVPIFNKGITKLQVEKSKINQSIAQNQLELQKQDIKQNVQKSFFDAQANYQNFVASIDAEKSTKLALDFAQKSYEAGKTTIYDLNIARNNWVNAQSNIAQSKFNYVFSLKLMNFYAGIPLTE